MSEPAETMVTGPLTGLPSPLQWVVLLLASAALTGLMLSVELPAALLIGPMLSAIAAGALGATLRMPSLLFAAAQATVGLVVGRALEPAVLASFIDIWPVLLLTVIATVAASSFLGWFVSRWKILPGTTAVWGSAPGAATAMVLMAGAFGADQRLVAFMQYLRVIFVTIAAALIARLWVDVPETGGATPAWLGAADPVALATTLAVGFGGAFAARLLRVPAPYFVGAFVAAALLHNGFGAPIELPPWLTGASYLVVGWTIGLKFDRLVLGIAVRALPQVVLSILALMAFCGGLGWLLHWGWGIDPLTAYLATSPGGMESVAIIAAASQNVNISFVMALQMARFLFVLLLGPPISRLVARWSGGRTC